MGTILDRISNWFAPNSKSTEILRATYPEEDILKFYENRFESVYVFLHPFIRPISIDIDRFNPSGYPRKLEILENCEAVEWKWVIENSDFRNIQEIDIGLRTLISGLREEVGNQVLARRIERFENEKGVVRPNEGELPELLQNRVFMALQKLGFDKLWVNDEFRRERNLETVADLLGDYPYPGHANFESPDGTFLVTTHWDFHFSFICSSRENIEKLLLVEKFEGFFCNEKTVVSWSLYNPDIRLHEFGLEER
ncbi:MAG TPA: DUF2711 family protein [Aridibacter sp.]|nr:DUF2711 family protein [Aridibacter sp.]